jgi:hypothetical protein
MMIKSITIKFFLPFALVFLIILELITFQKLGLINNQKCSLTAIVHDRNKSTISVDQLIKNLSLKKLNLNGEIDVKKDVSYITIKFVGNKRTECRSLSVILLDINFIKMINDAIKLDLKGLKEIYSNDFNSNQYLSFYMEDWSLTNLPNYQPLELISIKDNFSKNNNRDISNSESEEKFSFINVLIALFLSSLIYLFILISKKKLLLILKKIISIIKKNL